MNSCDFARYYIELNQFTRNIIRNTINDIPYDHIDDVNQHVWLMAWKYRERFAGDNFRNWIHSIARNQSRVYLKELIRERRRADNLTVAKNLSYEPWGTLTLEVNDVLSRVPSTQQKHILVLRYITGCSLDEISERVGVPVKTVFSRIRLARERVLSTSLRTSESGY